ncbi:MAG: hypothetical protein ACYTDU_05485 [Planctomycetota bacterium]
MLVEGNPSENSRAQAAAFWSACAWWCEKWLAVFRHTEEWDATPAEKRSFSDVALQPVPGVLRSKMQGYLDYAVRLSEHGIETARLARVRTRWGAVCRMLGHPACLGWWAALGAKCADSSMPIKSSVELLARDMRHLRDGLLVGQAREPKEPSKASRGKGKPKVFERMAETTGMTPDNVVKQAFLDRLAADSKVPTIRAVAKDLRLNASNLKRDYPNVHAKIVELQRVWSRTLREQGMKALRTTREDRRRRREGVLRQMESR